MTTPLHNEMAAALAELREQQTRITEAVTRLKAAEVTATSDDRLLQATVDSQGRLTELKFTGRRWRDLAPKELAARLVDVVNRAQDKAAEQSAGMVAGLMPAGMDLDALRAGAPGLDALFEAAIGDVTTGRWAR
ncbi:YbaB/EbfC family nucleoid-associated protein [Saccharothrix yanglingensis]|uniref:YbaB/EbfC DNA-binding family protein n=1 Tax=Saccharothrix yanglingensis TaxID=659496 RepID=A0ABU0XAE5_9PSEU|nr:YbaB/EbfC family nucleoid-associated protein [Saccharothrix yanglingensis]MDQ2589060.1 hypothetical protein [Saccharothrix yanglingensis]